MGYRGDDLSDYTFFDITKIQLLAWFLDKISITTNSYTSHVSMKIETQLRQVPHQ